ncbi:MAG: recombination mediator RecR, partial [Anaerococcus sp.]
MSLYPESLNNLIEEFQKLPTIGRKSAERLAMSIVEGDFDSVKKFSDSLIEVKENIKHCKICGNLTENDICGICKDISRDDSTICVIEDVRNLIAIEKSHAYHG